MRDFFALYFNCCIYNVIARLLYIYIFYLLLQCSNRFLQLQRILVFIQNRKTFCSCVFTICVLYSTYTSVLPRGIFIRCIWQLYFTTAEVLLFCIFTVWVLLYVVPNHVFQITLDHEYLISEFDIWIWLFNKITELY